MESINVDEEWYFNHIKAHEPDLERWPLRAQRVEEPQTGSELAADPYSPISEAVRLSLDSAGEHLRLAMTALNAYQLYPMAHFTTLRTALLAASQSVYILGHEEPSARRSRGLAVIVETYKRLRQYHQCLLDAPDVTELEKQQILGHVDWLSQRLETAREAGPDKRVIATNIVSFAAKITYGAEPSLENSVNLLWRQLSGDAHALLWPVSLRSTFDAIQKGQLLGSAKSGGSFRAIVFRTLSLNLSKLHSQS